MKKKKPEVTEAKAKVNVEAEVIKLLRTKKKARLKNCPIGLFLFDNELCLKTEYKTERGAIEAYIVSSGEFFWGGTNLPERQRELSVTPVKTIC